MKQAFTLIELLVVVLIIGILSAIALPQYQKAVLKTRTAEAVSMLKSLYQAQEVYYMTNQKCATGAHFEELDITIPDDRISLSGNCGTDTEHPNQYIYGCTQDCICNACAANSNLPILEIHGSNRESYPSALICSNYGKGDMADEICKNMGKYVYSWEDYKYYQIN